MLRRRSAGQSLVDGSPARRHRGKRRTWRDAEDRCGCVEDVVKEFPIDKNRMYLTGISMGGYGSWDLAVRQPDRWAAVVPICGGGNPEKASKVVRVPVWAVHGDADPAVPVEESRKMIAAIKAAGGDPKYTEYPGVAHDSWTQTYADPTGVVAWMFEQRLDKREKKAE